MPRDDATHGRRRALVTGGAGFIGSHLVEQLVERGDQVVVLDDLSTGKPENLALARGRGDVSVVVGSVLDDALVSELVASADVVFHLAGTVGVGLVMRDPIGTIESIVEGTRVVLRHAAKRRGCRVLVASSSEVYGPDAQGPLSESQRPVLGPPNVRRWAYASAKLTSEHLALAHHATSGLPVVVVRLFNTVGPRQTGAYGMVLPRFVGQALAGAPLTIYGDGLQTRSFCDVRDVAAALVRLERSERAMGAVVNVGADRPITIAALAERVQAVLGVSPGTISVPFEEAYGPSCEDARARVPALARMRELIGLVPARSLDETIRDLAAHVRRPSDLAAEL